jgi:hypothetical protein
VPGGSSAPAAPSAGPSITGEAFQAQLAKVAADRQALEQRLGTLYPQLSAQARVLAQQTAWMLASPAFADRLHARGAQHSSDGSRGVDVRQQAGALGALLMARGVARLGPTTSSLREQDLGLPSSSRR